MVAARLAWKGQTGLQASRCLAVTEATVNRWKNGKQLPSVLQYETLAKWLEADVDEISRGVYRQELRQKSEV